MTDAPARLVPGEGPLMPHRGGAVLALGIIGLAACFICGTIAWVMGSKDLAAMESGLMDPGGMGITRAGKICGQVATLLTVGFLLLYLLVVLVFGVDMVEHP